MEAKEMTDGKEELESSPSTSAHPTCESKTPEKTDRKRAYTSIFQQQSSSESETSDNELFSPGKAEKCEGILENLIKSELCKMNRTFKINKYRRKRNKSSQVTDENSTSESFVEDRTSIEHEHIEPEHEHKERRSGEYIDSSEKLHLSAEENERYATIAKDLDILNTHGGALDDRLDSNGNDSNDAKKLYTGPYGRILSPFKKFSSFQSFARGVKRSPRKFPAPVHKRPKLQLSSSSSDQSTPEKPSTFLYHIEKSPTDGESSDDSAEGLRIHEDSEMEEKSEEIDKDLQLKSEKFSLSAINVKSILHKIITNENVVEMVRKAVYEEIEETEAKFEPKMTRSKVKEALETQGTVPQGWGISPVKQRKEKSSFLEIELPDEEEDDEDFNPEELPADSDEDSESVVSSSCMSDLDSTMPSTPGTPGSSTSMLQKPSTPSVTDTDSQTMLSPMGPPLQNKVPKSQCQTKSLGQKFQDAMEKDAERKRAEEEELIASRTRSKYPLHDLSVFDIEANFVAPDITEDLYDTLCDNTEWQDFLMGLVKPAPALTTEDSVDLLEEEEDPEYNYLEEKEKETDDLEDFRDDRAVKVSKKELNQLLDELHDAYGENDPLDAECRKTIKAQTEQFLETSNKKEETQFQQSLVLQIGEHEKRQIDDQMRKHVQLLTQTFVMAHTGEEEHQSVADTAKMYLTEINKFADLSETVYSTTTYRACNLSHAVTIVNDSSWSELSNREMESDDEDNDEDESMEAYFKYDSQVLPFLSQKQMEILWSSPCFMFPGLLPHGAFFKTEHLKKDRARVKFLESEDNLLAMGMEQFKDLADPKEYIHQFMLPCKSKKQIQIRIKNLSTKAAKDNAVKFYKQYKTLPPMPQCAPMFDISQMVAVKDRDNIEMDELPTWCRKFRGGIGDFKGSKIKIKHQSLSFPMSSTGVTAIYFPPVPASAPTTPSNQQTDSSHMGSSGSSVDSHRSDTVSQAARPPTGPHKKKLDLNVATSSSSTGGFVPLTLTTPGNPITICVLNKLNKTTADGTSSVNTSVKVSASSQISTCVAPTIIFINNVVQAQAQSQSSLNTTVTTVTTTSTSSSCTPTSSVAPLTSKPDPIQSALISSNILSADSYTEMESDTSINMNYTASESSGMNVERNGTFLSTSIPIDSSGSTSTLALSSPGLGALSPMLPLPQSADGSSPAGNRTPGDITPTHSISCTVDYAGNQLTPEQLTPSSCNSSSGGTPKSAIEIMASYAPYFVSPSEQKNHGKFLQRSQESTPVKGRDGYVKLAPKPTPPSNEKPIEIKLEKKTFSPRRKQLQQRARSILPKGFVMSKFDSSPTKRLASSLVDKAKHLHKKPYGIIEGFRKILPYPFDPGKDKTYENQESLVIDKKVNDNYCSNRNKKTSQTVTRTGDTESDITGTDTAECVDTAESMDVDGGVDEDGGLEGEDKEGDTDGGLEGEDKGGDTESEYTQSEDGNDTQEDSQEDGDSQEEEPDDDETHLANLMHASTTVRCDFPRDEVSKARMCKKDRDRDISLAMLAPDIIESDQQRDYRDTAFAQAYLHKVKKALRDDMDTLEKFLQLMYNFSKTNESPVKLYKDLDGLFVKYPELMADFAGFLLPEQAVECDCYETHQEFNMARTFLRKLEIYFSKAPHQFHKVMKTFSRWYRKPGRRVGDLREQIEPMLKGQRYLLEEFSKFFPDQQPPESMMDDFEEIRLEDSDEDDQYDSVEEIDLLDDDEESLGTKRCECDCHDTGDDHYRKKKKHCYRCCLTVIDGELVYRVNKTTIKRINVTFGPSIRVGDVIGTHTDTENHSDSELDKTKEPVSGEATLVSGEETSVTGETTTGSADWFIDGEAAEKENIEHYQTMRPGTGQRKQDKARSIPKHKSESDASQKPTFLQRISKLSRPVISGKPVRLSDMVSTALVQTSQQQSPTQASVSADNTSQEMTELSGTETNMENISETVTKQEQIEIDIQTTSSFKESTQQRIDVNKPQIIMFGMANTGAEQVKQDLQDKGSNLNNSKANSQSDSAFSVSLNMSSGSNNNDILAAAFSSAMMTEVSMDSMSLPFALQCTSKSPEKKVSSTRSTSVECKKVLSAYEIQRSSLQSVQCVTVEKSTDQVISPKPVAASSTSFSSVSAPVGPDNLAVSTNTSFTKVDSKLTDSPVKHTLSSTQHEPEQVESDGVVNAKEIDDLMQQSKSPNFSPFSPYAAEVQAIISQPSPLANVSSPGVVGQAGKVITSSKIRRITPIQVSESSQHSISSFQSAVENSPLICESSVISNPFEKFGQDSDSNPDKPSCSTAAVIPTIQVEVSGSSTHTSESPSFNSNSQHSAVLSSSQKSDSNTKSDHSESVPCNIQISEPVVFSENANKEFPLPPGSGTMLSEDSLLHCLGNKSHMEDHIHSISNLTNILYALEEKPVQSQSKVESNNEKTRMSVVSQNEVSCTDSTEAPISTSEIVEKCSSEIDRVNPNTEVIENPKSVSSNDSSSSDGATSDSYSDTGTLTPGDMGTGRAETDEQLSPKLDKGRADTDEQHSPKLDTGGDETDEQHSPKLDTGRAETDEQHSPKLDTGRAETDEQHSPKLDTGRAETDEQHSPKLDTGRDETDEQHSPKLDTGRAETDEQHSPKLDTGRAETDEQHSPKMDECCSSVSALPGAKGNSPCQTKDTTPVIDTLSTDSHTDRTYKPKYRDKDKPESHENSVMEINVVSSVRNEYSNCAKDVNESAVGKGGFTVTDPNSISVDTASGVCDNVDGISSSQCSSVDGTVPSSADLSGMVTPVEPTGQLSDDNADMADNCDSEQVSEEQNTKHKDKHKKKKSMKQKKKKHSKDGAGTVFDKIKMFACTSAAVGQSTPERLPSDTSMEAMEIDDGETASVGPNEKGDADSVSVTSDAEELATTSEGLFSATDLCSEVSSPSSSIEGHEWSKDTDKKILEACKTHGIKEKTFIKIAKQIGNVTPKQGTQEYNYFIIALELNLSQANTKKKRLKLFHLCLDCLLKKVRKRFGQLYKLILKPRLPKT